MQKYEPLSNSLANLKKLGKDSNGNIPLPKAGGVSVVESAVITTSANKLLELIFSDKPQDTGEFLRSLTIDSAMAAGISMGTHAINEAVTKFVPLFPGVSGSVDLLLLFSFIWPPTYFSPLQFNPDSWCGRRYCEVFQYFERLIRRGASFGLAIAVSSVALAIGGIPGLLTAATVGFGTESTFLLFPFVFWLSDPFLELVSKVKSLWMEESVFPLEDPFTKAKINTQALDREEYYTLKVYFKTRELLNQKWAKAMKDAHAAERSNSSQPYTEKNSKIRSKL